MKYVVLLIGVMTILSFGCDVKSQHEDSTISYISEKTPFQISEGEKSISIPKYLKPVNFAEGTLIIYYFVDAEGVLEGINLGLLRMKDKNGEKLIWYRNKNLKPISKEEYPKEIIPFIDFVFEYAKSRKVEQIAESKYKSVKYLLFLPLKIE